MPGQHQSVAERDIALLRQRHGVVVLLRLPAQSLTEVGRPVLGGLADPGEPQRLLAAAQRVHHVHFGIETRRPLEGPADDIDPGIVGAAVGQHGATAAFVLEDIRMHAAGRVQQGRVDAFIAQRLVAHAGEAVDLVLAVGAPVVCAVGDFRQRIRADRLALRRLMLRKRVRPQQAAKIFHDNAPAMLR